MIYAEVTMTNDIEEIDASKHGLYMIMMTRLTETCSSV
jgi:hypothetical protein